MPRKRVPDFETIEKEADFWDEHDTTDYVEPGEWEHVQLPNLRPSSKRVTIRIPEGLLNGLKSAGHRRGVPYQSLVKTILFDWLRKEDAAASSKGKRKRA